MKDKIIVEAIDYIKKHLSEDLTVEDIASHCHFSKHYFNRLFKAQVGESVYAFIKRLRIEKSASKMAREKETSITEIACEFGYSSSNYSTAFKKRYKKSPAQMKRDFCGKRLIESDRGYFADLRQKDFQYYDKRMKIEEIKEFEVIYKRFITDYHNLSGCWNEFCGEFSKYSKEDSRYIEISYDDPLLTDPDRCITDLCMTTSERDIEGCSKMKIAGGRYLVYDFQGKAAEIFETYQGIFRIWLEQSSCRLDFNKRKMFCSYISADCGRDFFSMEIFIPIK